MNSYLGLLQSPGVARLMTSQLIARFPGGMLSLAFLIHIEQIYHSYGVAGLVLAAVSAGRAITGPLTSRWIGHWGMRRVIILTLIVCSIAVSTIAFAPKLPVVVYMVVGLVAGLSNPPIQPAVRLIYPKLVNSSQLVPLYSLDASAQEIIWIIGPVITTLLATQISPVLAIAVAIAFMVSGGIWFVASPEVGEIRIPRARRKVGVVMTRPPVLLAAVTGFLLLGGTAAVDAGVVATFGEDGPQAGIVLALFAIGALVGGLVFGHRPIGPWALAVRIFGVFAGIALATAFLDFWWLSATLLIAGLGVAPALAVMFTIVSSSVKFSETAEAYGWVGSGQLVGAGLGSAAAGFMIDALDARGAFWVACTLTFLGFLVAMIFRRALPDLRGRDVSPIPDTGPIPIVN